MSRPFAADDTESIGRRLAEIRAAEDAARAGCLCPQDGLGTQNHALNCPLRPADDCPALPAIVPPGVRPEPTGCADDCCHPAHAHGAA